MSKKSNLVFVPCNYIFDPKIRNAFGSELEGSIVIFYKAHNVEDTLRGVGSGKFGVKEICELVMNQFTPGIFMEELSSRCTNLVFASELLAHFQILCKVFDLLLSSSERLTHTKIPKSSSDQIDIHN